MRQLLASIAYVSIASVLLMNAVVAQDIDFNRDIKPILSDKCYACHGPDGDQRQGGGDDGLRFDTKEGAFAELDGVFAIVPGDLEASGMIQRITADDPEERMPPTDHRKSLSKREQSLLVRWVQQGANWSQHWAYVAPQPSSRKITLASPPSDGNWIDTMILQQLSQRGLSQAPQATRRVLIRRLFFDLVGLPPSADQVEQFLSDETETAWEDLVDRLLASPHFGERMAIHWLDLVRYADTVGYHGDQDVSVSPFRDYVIDAFNSNMPFDRFTREQLAGDLLTNPTRDQLIASGYNKLGMMSAEGGAQPKEYLAKYASDRVRTASTLWLGSTLGCAECHDHKFDPFTQQDFYRFAAFFADIQERGLYSGANKDGNWGPSIKVPDDELANLLEPIDARIEQLKASYQSIDVTASLQQWESRLRAGDSDWQALRPEAMKALHELPEEVQSLIVAEETSRSDQQRRQLTDYYRSVAPEVADIRDRLADAEKERADSEQRHTRRTLITKRVEPREVRVLRRGDWMDQGGEVVEPGVPHFLPPLQVEGRATRLDLARWLTSKQNPLTARVFVNRLWKTYFGIGLSKILDDIGSQGEFPIHADLLDELAIEFAENGWNIKRMIKLIVMSATYRQSSLMRDDLAEVDPYNRLLARQSRFRLDAELIRDNALSVSGLLVRDIGGRSVKPYQPSGLLRHLNFPKRTYQHDRGTNQYRRGVYTHWQRQFLHPAMKSFDAPAREECTAERSRSNTPLAALVLLNDPSYVEAARVFAQRILHSKASTDGERIDAVFAEALSRDPSEQERAILETLIQSQRKRYSAAPETAAEIVSIGQQTVDDDLDLVELASLLSVTRAVFNMHEFITRN